MASGKSHVGRLLSEKLGRPLVDADAEIVKRKGKPVHRIFQEEGEAAFRAIESSVITELCGASGAIIAAGGGAFVDPGNRRVMLERGTVFCLSASPETIYARVRKGNKSYGGVRPLLAGDHSLERIKSLLDQRADAYAQAHYTVQTDSLTPDQVAERIVGLLHGKKPIQEDING